MSLCNCEARSQRPTIDEALEQEEEERHIEASNHERNKATPCEPSNDGYEILVNTSSSDPEMNIEIDEKPHLCPDNMRIVSSCLTYNQDNLLHIMSADCEPVTSTTKLLMDLDLIDLKSVKYRRPRVGEILVSPRSQFSIFNWIVKEKFYDRTMKANLRNGLLSLKNLLLKRKQKSIRIPLRGILPN